MESTIRAQSVEVLAPLAGAVVGGLGCAFIAARLPIRREAVAVGAGVVGLLVASHTNGIANRVAIGVAAAGASMLAVEILRRIRPDWTLFSAPQRQAGANDVVTRKDLDEALARTADAASSDAPKDEAVQHLDEVNAQLTSEERASLDKLRRTSPHPVVAEVERQLRAMSVGDAVRFLRLNILPHAQADDHAQR